MTITRYWNSHDRTASPLPRAATAHRTHGGQPLAAPGVESGDEGAGIGEGDERPRPGDVAIGILQRRVAIGGGAAGGVGAVG